MTSTDKKEDKGVQSVDRVLDIIEVLAVEHNGLGITEISNRVALHKSTAHRLVSTLARRGYIDKTESGNYKIGLKLIEAVSCYINSLELQTEARPYLAQITANLGLTSHLGILDGDKVVYLEKMDVISSVKMYSQIGLRIDAYCSSLGKCLLSNYSSKQLTEKMQSTPFIKYTDNTIGSLAELHEEIKKVRLQGWAMDDEEFEMGHRCISAPIFDYRGDIVAAISASGNVNVLTDKRLKEVIEYVKSMAAEISKTMGYVG